MPAAGAIAGIGSALIGASSAKKAARAQERAGREQLALQERMYEETTGRYQPFYDAGRGGLDAYMYELGLGGRPTVGGGPASIEEITTRTPGNPGGMQFDGNDRPIYGQAGGTSTSFKVGGQTFGTREEAQAYANQNPTGGTAYQGFTGTPGYQFRVDQGNSSVNALAGARGGLDSGATRQALMEFGQGIASQEYGGHLNRLAGLTDMGSAAAGNMAQAGNALANGGSNALGNIGNAQSAGIAGVNQAIQGGIGQLGSFMGYQRANADPLASALKGAGVTWAQSGSGGGW